MNRRLKTSDVRLSKRQAPGSVVINELAWVEIARSLKLSGRELQIVRGVFHDRTEFAIADDLNISTHTVHSHIERLHHKLAVKTRVELVLRVMDEFITLTICDGSVLPPLCANWAANRCPLRSRRLTSRLPTGLAGA